MTKNIHFKRYPSRLLTLIGIFIFVILLYWSGAQRHLTRINTDMNTHDQSAYMTYARNMHETGGTYVGDGARAPLYPGLQALHYSSDTAKFFEQGKQWNVILSVALLLGLFLIFLRYLPPHAAINLFLMTAFTVFIFKAAYFQPELLYYFVSFCAFLGMVKLLVQPTWKLGLLTGGLLGLAHLIKPSVLPAVALFIVCFLAQSCYQFYKKHDFSQATFGELLKKDGIIFASVVLTFLLVGAPLFYQNQRTFGSFFYNVNSNFYIWYDSWDEAVQGTRAYGDRVGWPKMPADKLPSPQKYVREHSIDDIIERFDTGLETSEETHCEKLDYGYCRFVKFQWRLTLALFMLAFPAIPPEAFRRYFFAGLFCAGYFLGYLLLYAWFVPINAGQRFMLSLFLPFMFITTVVINYKPIREQAIRVGPNQKVSWVTMANCYITALLIPEIYIILDSRIVAFNAGG